MWTSATLFVKFNHRKASLYRQKFIYRIDDSPEGVEASQNRKHMLDSVRNGGQLYRKRGGETEV